MLPTEHFVELGGHGRILSGLSHSRSHLHPGDLTHISIDGLALLEQHAAGEKEKEDGDDRECSHDGILQCITPRVNVFLCIPRGVTQKKGAISIRVVETGIIMSPLAWFSVETTANNSD